VISDPPQCRTLSLSNATTQGKTLGDSVPLIILPVEVPLSCLLLCFALNVGKEAVTLDFGTDVNKFSLELMFGCIPLAMPQASTTENGEVNDFNKSEEERQVLGAFVLSLCTSGREWLAGRAAAWAVKKEMALRHIRCVEGTQIGQNWLSIVSDPLGSETALLASDT